jgi:hypothetical protein
MSDDEYYEDEYDEYETEEFVRWFYGKINMDEANEIAIEVEKEEERRWYYGYEKDY